MTCDGLVLDLSLLRIWACRGLRRVLFDRRGLVLELRRLERSGQRPDPALVILHD